MVSTHSTGGKAAPHKHAHKKAAHPKTEHKTASFKADNKHPAGKDAPKATGQHAQKTKHSAHGGVSKHAADASKSYAMAHFKLGNNKKADKPTHNAGKAGKSDKKDGKSPKKHDVDVAVIDWYGDKKDPHGETVAKLVDKNAKDVDKNDVKQVQIHESPELPDKLMDTNLDEYISRSVSDSLNDLSTSLEEVNRHPGKTKVINHSGGIAPIEIYDDVFEPSLHDAGNIKATAVQLGLPETATKQEVKQAAIDRIQNTLKNSPEVQAAKTRYNKVTADLAKKGIVTVIAAGNTGGEEIAKLKAEGLRFDSSFVDSVNANNNVILVNTVDSNGTKKRNDDVTTWFTTPESQTDFAVNDNSTPDGNSFSAPLVAAAVAEIKTYLPNASFKEVYKILQKASTDTPGVSRKEEGNGVIDIQRAIAIAKRRAS